MPKIYEIPELEIRASFVGKKTPVEMWRAVKGPKIYVVRKKIYNFFL